MPRAILSVLLASMLLLLSLAAAGPARGQADARTAVAEAPVAIRGALHPEYTRIVIDFPTRTQMTWQQAGEEVRVRFDTERLLDVEALVRLALPRLRAARQEADDSGATVLVMDLDPAMTLRPSVVGTRQVLDIREGVPPPEAVVDADPTPSPTAETAAIAPELLPSLDELEAGAALPITAAPDVRTAPEPERAAIPAPSPVPGSVVEPTPLDPLPAADGEGGGEGEGDAVELAASDLARYDDFFERIREREAEIEGLRNPQPAADQSNAGGGSWLPPRKPPPPEERADPSRAEQPGQAGADPSQPRPERAPLLATDVRTGPRVGDALPGAYVRPRRPALLDAGSVDDLSEIRIDPGQTVPAAIWRRGRHLWTLLPIRTLTLAPFITGTQGGVLRDYRQFQGEGWIALRFPLPDDAGVSVRREGRLWQITVADSVIPPSPIPVALTADPVAQGRALEAQVKTLDRLDVVDPVVGDRLILFTSDDPSQGLDAPVETVDATLLPSYAGLAIRPNADGLVVQRGENGVLLSRPEASGLRLSRLEGISHLVSPITAHEGVPARVYDFERWAGRAGESWTDADLRLQRLTQETPADQRPFAWLDHARLHLAHGLGPEALGQIERAIDFAPELADQPEVQGLLGAAHLLSFRPAEAANNLIQDGVGERDEAQLWKAVALTQLGETTEAMAGYRLGRDLVQTYPRVIQARLAPDLLELALASGDPVLLESELTTLRPAIRRGRHARPQLVDYYTGELHHLRGEGELAVAALNRATTGEDWYVRTRALLRLIEVGLPEGAIDPEEAIERLERLRYGWRGDELEAHLLRQLGRLYLQTGEPREAFDTFKTAVGFFPGTDIARQVAAEMSDSFAGLFLDPGRAADMTAIEAYALYQDYEELAPDGEEGARVIDALAERMLALDLLELSAELLEKQFRYHDSATERARLGVRLAAIHLLDDEPDEALAVLDRLESLRAQSRDRALLRARALSAMGDVDGALAILDRMSGEDVARLSVDVAWKAGRWQAVSAALLPLLPPTGETALDDEQAQLVLNRAVAMSLAEDEIGLAAMRADYATAMADSRQAYAFDILTRPDQLAVAADVVAVQAQIEDAALFDGFLEKYRGALPPLRPDLMTSGEAAEAGEAGPGPGASGN